MNFTSVGFVLIMCAMGAGIAALADTVGRNIGKKKHSIWKLRPRHTATLFAAIAGFVIPFATISILAVASRDVRRMLLESATIESELKRLQGDRKVQQDELARLQNQNSQTRQELTEVLEQRKKLTGANANLTQKNQNLNQQIGKAAQELRQEQAAAQAAKREADAGKRTVAKLTADARRLGAAMDTLRADLEKGRGEIRDLTSQQSKVQTRLKEYEDLNIQLTQAEQRLSESIDRLRTDLSNLNKEAQSNKQNNERLQAEIGEKQKELNGLVTARNELDREINELRSLSSVLQSSLIEFRQRPLTFAIEEEIARYIVPARSDEDEARQAFNRMKSVARQKALERGATSDNEFDAISFIPIRDERSNRVLSPVDQELQVIKRITNRREQVVLIAKARVNSFQGEFVRWTVQDFDNPVVYQEGQILGETRVSGAATSEEIFAEISRFIREEISARALRDRLIPATGSDSPLGQISEQTILQLISEVQGYPRIVRVQAIAERETRRADPLRIVFRVR